MRSDLADVTVVLDRSGSMAVCKDEAEGGLNAFIDEQKKAEGRCHFTLVQFDTQYEFVHRGVSIQDVPRFTLEPRGMTALLDAVGRAINETGERLSKIPEAERPGLIVFVIVTDGQENSSSEFTLSQVKQMIQRQQNEYSWQFQFLGANQDAFAEASALGIPQASAGNYRVENTSGAIRASSSSVKRMRSLLFAGQTVSSAYTDEERRQMEGKNAVKTS